jgi:hypothetical protein
MLRTQGLVGYWPLENTVLDASGSGNNGTAFNLSYVEGKLGRGGTFNGSSTYISVGAGKAPTGTLTAAFWIKPATTSGIAGVIGEAIASSAEGSFIVDIHRTAKRLSVVWAGNVILTSGTDVDTGWHHIALVRSGSTGNWTATLYLDARSDGTANTAINPTPQGNLTIGRYGDYPLGAFFNGDLDEVCLWNRALSATDIRRLMLGMVPIG